MTEEHNTGNQHSVKEFAKEALHDLLHFDKKIFRSLRDLVFKPGILTISAVKENSTKYMKPLGLFIFVNFLFFVFKFHGLLKYNLDAYVRSNIFKKYILHELESSKLSYQVFEAQFNTAMQFEQKGFFILLVPLLALGMKLIYLNKPRYYVEHLVFAFHFFSFFLLYLLFIPAIYFVLFGIVKITGMSIPDNEITLLVAIIPVMAWWTALALKKYYNEGWAITFIKTIVIVALLFSLIAFVYRSILFFIVLHAI